jgi:ABC-type molybdate transport system substrate-binding protein
MPLAALAPQINLGDSALADVYAQTSYTTAAGVTQRGAPIAFSVTIPATVRDEAGAEAFVAYLLGSQGRAALTAGGFSVSSPTLTGDATQLPASLKQYGTS